MIACLCFGLAESAALLLVPVYCAGSFVLLSLTGRRKLEKRD